MKGLKLMGLAVLTVMMSCKVSNKMEKVELNSELSKVSYSIGVNVARYYQNEGMDSMDAAAFAQAITDVYAKDSLKVTDEEAQTLMRSYFEALKSKKHEGKVKEGKDFLEANGKKDGIKTTASGLQYEVLVEGTGATPALTDKVKTHYHGTKLDGTVFDSSVQRGEAISFPVNGVIPGWTEALQLMKVGGKWKLYIPAELAYGERGAGQQIGPFETLIFEIELIDIEK